MGSSKATSNGGLRGLAPPQRGAAREFAAEADRPGLPAAPDYAALFEYAPAGYMQLDAAGCIETINRAGAALLGWDCAWLVGKPFSRWVAVSDRAQFHAHRDNLQAGAQPLSQELRIKNRQGRTVALRLQSASARRGGAAGFSSIMIDVSDDERSARQLRQLQSQIAHIARVGTAGELATSLAHELNQPLGTVVLNCDAALRLLNGGAGRDDEFAEALTQARESACFASEIVRHLRGFLRESDELRSVCELAPLIYDVSRLIEIDARDNDVELQLDIEPLLPRVEVDRVQIEQVLVNLARNSIEAMRERERGSRRVSIAARCEGPNRVMVAVADTGPGIAAGQFDRIFDPFFTTKSGGMGMGLSISRTIIEAHGGRLWAESDPGNGTTLRFTLPAAGRDAG